MWKNEQIELSLEDSDPNQQDKSVTIKKGTFSGLVVGIIIAVGVAAFFAGSHISDQNSNQFAGSVASTSNYSYLFFHWFDCWSK